MAGYSKTPLIKKLGIKPGVTVLPVLPPKPYVDIVGSLPDGARIVNYGESEPVDFIHLFAKDDEALVDHFADLKAKLDNNGMLWVSWIKKASKMETNISEQDVRSMGLQLGLVDVKICAVDEDWSGLKFMYRKEDR